MKKATQALIVQLAASQKEVEGSDDISECDLFDENNEVLIPNPQTARNSCPTRIYPHIKSNKNLPGPEMQKTQKRGQKT